MKQSTEEEIDGYYSIWDNAKTQYKSKEITTIMGDLNAKVGKEHVCKIVVTLDDEPMV